MARLFGDVVLPPAAVSAGTAYQIFVGVAPSNHRVAITEFYVGDNYNTNGTPGLLQFGFASAAGSGGSALTIARVRRGTTETFQSTWTSMPSSPATSVVLAAPIVYINPQISITERAETVLEMAGGDILVVTFTPQVSTSVAGRLRIEE